MKSLVDLCKQPNIDRNKQFNVEVQRDCRRWFNGDIKVFIYQTDGAEVSFQCEKMELR